MNIIELHILGHKITIKSDKDPAYIREVESYLNGKFEEIRQGAKTVSTLDLAVLAALNVTGEFIKTRQALENMETRAMELNKLIDRRI